MRVIAFRLRSKFKSQSKVLLPSGLKRAVEKVPKLIQRESFPGVIEGKQMFGETNTGGNLANFSPFCDETGMLRIRGRIRHANLRF